MRLTVAIPTLNREQVLIETLKYLLALRPPADEILVVDQTSVHEPAIASLLNELHQQGKIRLLHQTPSIPRAMNRALQEASSELVLFVDDDIVPDADLFQRHLTAHQQADVLAVVGQVLQPGEQPEDIAHVQTGHNLKSDLQFCFRSTQAANVLNVMAGNLSVKRDVALAAGGFDENFVGVAYRFETEFCRRLNRYGGVVRYEPSACIRHLAAPRGGTRSFGGHLKSSRPEHSVGDYYFAMLEGRPVEGAFYMTRRFFRSVMTRFHLKHPWWIPVKLLGETRGFFWALRLRSSGQKLVGK